MEALRELRDLTLRHAGADLSGSLPNDALGLKFFVARPTREPEHYIYKPVFNLVVQGEKRVVLGRRHLTCPAGHFLVFSVDLPITVHLSASRALPFVAVGIALEPVKVATLLLEMAVADASPTEPAPLGVSHASPELIDAIVRLVRLLDHPDDLPVLGPLVEREILWRLLSSEQGRRVRQIGLADSRLSQIAGAMRWMRQNYGRMVHIEELARVAAMSVTSFHRHFRAVTLMSPVQYLKHVRLQEARVRLLAGIENVTTVGFTVGYESPSQFSREYKRAFGAPPRQDARILRASKARSQDRASK